MKDFNEIIQQSKTQATKMAHYASHIDIDKQLQSTLNIRIIKKWLIQSASFVMITAVTAPFNTASTLLQISEKPLADSLTMKINKVGKSHGQVSSLIKLGVFGDNKMYKPFQFVGYNDCLRQMGKEGFRGLYKGAFTGALLSGCNSKLRTWLYKQTLQRTKDTDSWKTNLYTILTCTIADFCTLPLMFAQSRLTFQNSCTNFRTYRNLFSVLRTVKPSSIWAGSSLLLLKNILFTATWLSFIKDSPLYSFILSTVLSHLTIYPFVTVIRQLQCNDIGAPMMHQRKQSVFEAMKRIWGKQGFRGFYRGFLGYSLVHLFMGIIVVETNIRSGYFQQNAI